MSVYIQIATVEDYNITHTVRSALRNALDRVNIGIAATVGDEFYEKVILPLTDDPRVKSKKFDPIKDRGLGRGRINSRWAYDGETYILQVDAHTNFESQWDATLVFMYNGAEMATRNPRTLMTGYLGKYKMINGKAVIVDRWTGYSVWPHNDVTPKVPLRGVAVTKVADFPDHILENKTKKFYPANRIGGNFVFGTYEWARFQGWSGKEVFWEEEITPAITLLQKGFSLAFPNMEMPLTHLYWPDDLSRQTMDDMFEDPEDIDILAIKHIEEFVANNKAACERYKDYSGYDLATNSLTYKVFVPQKYEF